MYTFIKIRNTKNKGGFWYMKFIKGVMIGTLVSAGAIWMFSEASNMETKKMMKKGKKFLKNMCM